MNFKSAVLAALTLTSVSAFARPTKLTLLKDNSIRPATAAELHNLASTSGCSAGYVDLGRGANDKAVIITNGHCTDGSLVARQAMVNLPVNKSFAIFLANGSKYNVTATRLLYASLMETDVAFYEINKTNAELDAKGLTPFALYNGEGPLGSAVRITSGYWRETQECTLERRVPKIIEGFGSDISKPSVATNGFALSKACNIRGGYSGTPVVDTNSNTLIAIAFTGAEGNEACAEMNPCEEDEAGNRTYHKGVSYAARLDLVTDCLLNGEFDLALPSCTMFH